MADRILTHHISAYHALQGTADDLRKVLGRGPEKAVPIAQRCDDCAQAIGEAHLRWCPYGPGDVWVEDTPGGQAAS